MFQLSSAVLAQYREQAESAFHDTVSFYSLTVTRDVYGNESYSSGIVATYPCLLAGITGKDEELVARLVTDGRIKSQTAKCLTKWNANVDETYIAVVSGSNKLAGEWEIAYDNSDITSTFKLYTKLILTRDKKVITYKDDYRRNG